MIRSCVGISAAVCVAWGACSSAGNVTISALSSLRADAEEAPKLVILGREDEETIALIAETLRQADGSVMSLDDYLNPLICGACNRKCSLLSPRCRRGKTKAETQTGYYNEALVLIASEEAEF